MTSLIFCRQKTRTYVIPFRIQGIISQGNVVDLAVGVVVGAAFAKIVDSLVTDVLMPPIGMMIGGVNFEDLKIVLKEATVDAAGKVTEPIVAIVMECSYRTVYTSLL